jgi:hypothetical protein
MTFREAKNLGHAGNPRSVEYGEIISLRDRAARFLDEHGDRLTHQRKPDARMERMARLRALAITRGEYKTEGRA